MDLNKAMIIGNVTKDPELKTIGSGQNVASFSIATNLVWTDQSGQKQQKAEFHNIVAWRRLAEICAQYLKKGAKIYLEGRIQTRDWMAQDGTKRFMTEIVAENMIMLDRAGGAAGGGGNPQFQGGGNQFQAAPVQPAAQSPEPPTISVNDPVNNPINQGSPENNPHEEEVKVEDIPF